MAIIFALLAFLGTAINHNQAAVSSPSKVGMEDILVQSY